MKTEELKDLKNFVGKEKMVRFVYYSDSELWYECENGFRFPVPLSDIGPTTFNAVEKSIHLMRWIRKHTETLISMYASADW